MRRKERQGPQRKGGEREKNGSGKENPIDERERGKRSFSPEGGKKTA